MGSPLVFKIFYSGATKFYFRNQFYRLYNNSEEVFYLDGLCPAYKLTPIKPLSSIWPEEDKEVYTERLWRIPGSGTDYPLSPGESCIISQFAAKPSASIYNPDSPVDLCLLGV